MSESKYKIGDYVSKRWKVGDKGLVKEVAIASGIKDNEYYVYVVEFPACTGGFLEGDLINYREDDKNA